MTRTILSKFKIQKRLKEKGKITPGFFFSAVIQYNTVAIFFLLIILSSLISDSFFTSRNIFNLLRQVTPIGIISMGMLLVILTGGIDLSVGSIVALSSVLVSYFISVSLYPLFFSLLFAVLIAAGLGAVSGILITKGKMAPFVVTLAMMTIARGGAFIVSKGSPIMIAEKGEMLKNFGSAYFLGIPQPIFLMFFLFLIVMILLRQTVYGRLVVAIGSNEECAELSGVRTQSYKLSVYTIAASFSAVAGIISTSRTGVGSPIIGVGYELDAIAAVVIGGASLNGGKGSALSTLLGIFILGIIGNIMNLANVPAYPQQVIKGLIIIFAVLLQGIQDKQHP